MKKFSILSSIFIATAIFSNSNYVFADTTQTKTKTNANGICKVKKIKVVPASSKDNLVGLDYELFNVKHESHRKNIEKEPKDFSSDGTFFIFKEPYANLTPPDLNAAKFKEGCLASLAEWKALPSDELYTYDDSYNIEPIFISKDKKYLITTIGSYMFSGGAHGIGGMEYRFYNTETQTKLDVEKLLEDAFKDSVKDKNFSYKYNPQLVAMIKNKIKADKEYYNCLFDKGENLYFPTNVGILKNTETKQNQLFAYYSVYEIAPYACGPYEISFTPEEINKFLKPNSILYKLLNNEI